MLTIAAHAVVVFPGVTLHCFLVYQILRRTTICVMRLANGNRQARFVGEGRNSKVESSVSDQRDVLHDLCDLQQVAMYVRYVCRVQSYERRRNSQLQVGLAWIWKRGDKCMTSPRARAACAFSSFLLQLRGIGHHASASSPLARDPSSTPPVKLRWNVNWRTKLATVRPEAAP